jgi:molybdopterin converting factor small subunit
VRVAVRLGGGLAGAAGATRLAVDVPGPPTVAALLERLGATHPGLRPGLASALVVVRGAHAAPDRVLDAGDEVALLLPAAGG